ncbi:unnamed protein product [Effrenium voratum]|uniref:EF-hand domain-containing protein n=1 Tax=Effrenium voratum TaxID=2562239 RepID=A0AA36HLF3_9DINO|nr:unnamed protein product [Effrenium voratum]
MDAGVPTLSLETKLLLQKLKMIWDKIAGGKLHSITLSDVQAVFDILDPGEKGYITRNECHALQQLSNVKLSRSYLIDLCEDADQDNSGTVTAEEFLKALTTGKVAFNYLRESLNKGPKEVRQNECDRSDLLVWLKHEYETTSALYSMPTVFLLLIVYIYFVTTHVDVTNAWRVQSGLHENIDSLHKAPLMMNRHGQLPHMEWTANSWLPRYYHQDLNLHRFPGRVTSYNQMLGGSRLHKEYYQSGACSVNSAQAQLYNSKDGTCDRHGGITEEDDIVLPYHLHKSIHEFTIDNLTKSYWFDNHVDRLEYQTMFYNGQVNMITFERLQFILRTDGHLQFWFHHESWTAEPYLNAWNVLPDILFAVLLLRIAQAEVKELVPAIAGGVDGLKDYLGFWNIVDWMAITVGFFNIGMWLYIFVMVSVDLPQAIAQIPQAELDARVLQNQTYLTLDDLAEVIEPAVLNQRINEMFMLGREVYDWHLLLRCCFFGYFFILILKFFKSFQANPRLDVVVQTINHCSVNVAHFAIVFLAIFLCYAFAGHFLLGHKHKGWSSMLGSVYMCWSTSLSMDMVKEFSVPIQAVCFAWTLSYQVLVQQVMLNMLYCIVFDSYAYVKNRSGTPQTLFAQIRSAAATARETRGFVNLYTLIVQLEDDDFPAHPNEVVTVRSLKRAFERDGMSRLNAEYLMRQTADYAQEKGEDVEITLSDAIRVTGHIQKNTMLKNLVLSEDSLDMITTEARNKEAAEKQQDRAAFVSNTLGEMPQFEKVEGKDSVADETCDALEQHLIHVSTTLQECRQEQANMAADVNAALEEIWKQEDRRYSKVDLLIHDLEQGLQAVEHSIGSMGVSFSGTNFQQLASVPDRCDTPQILEALTSRSASSDSCVERLDLRLSELKEHMHELSEASQTEELRELFWQLELSLRNLNGGKRA